MFLVTKLCKEIGAIPSQKLLWHQSKNSNGSQFLLDNSFQDFFHTSTNKVLKKESHLNNHIYIY